MATTMVVKRRLVVLAMAMAVALAGTGVVSAKAVASHECSGVEVLIPPGQCLLK